MTSKEAFIKKLEKVLPELCRPADLVSLGIFGSRNTLAADRRAGKGIPYISFSKHRTRYPRENVLEYVKENFHDLNSKKDVPIVKNQMRNEL